MSDLTSLLVAAREGDRLALASAIRGSQAEVWQLACHLVGRDDADDVTQDTYVRAWRALPRFRGESSGRTWLLAIARRACADAVRRRVRERRLAERLRARPAARATGPDLAATHGLGELVEALDDDRREAFVLTQLVGCSYAEAAEVCGVAVGTIRSRVARARVELVDAARAADTG
ncbi:MAG TPA: sigma-70 family RNA polymerase sigma factor [Acidimicrobiia bacterium]